MRNISPEKIDAILPQTQCGLCGYGGCMPYANALAFENAAINLCPPGGIETLQQLGSLLNEDPIPYKEEMLQKSKPKSVAVIREAECIGCTKCIQACPVDSILGSAKQMHTVIASECTGCELCVEPCPVDCIDIISLDEVITETQSQQYRQRFNARQLRIKEQIMSAEQPVMDHSLSERKNYLEDAIARARAKRLTK